MAFQKMYGEVSENSSKTTGGVSFDLSPMRHTKTMLAIKAPYSVKRITFDWSCFVSIIVLTPGVFKSWIFKRCAFTFCHCNIFFQTIFQLNRYFFHKHTMAFQKMYGEVPENSSKTTGGVSFDLSPMRHTKTMLAMKAPYSVKRITFDCSEANPGETLQVHVPKLNKNEVLVPCSLALRFDIDLSGGHANNYLVQNVSCALVSRQVVRFGGTTLDDISDYYIFKIVTDLFLPEETRGNMMAEGIQSKKLSQIRSGTGDKPTSGVDAENKLEKVYGKKYRINLDHQILTDHGVFYPQALYTGLVFELLLTPADQVVKGPDKDKLKYRLTNIQLEYEMIRSEDLAKVVTRVYENGKEFLYDHVSRVEMMPIATTSPLINIKVKSQRRSMKGILLLLVKPYTAGTRDSEEYIFPDLQKSLRDDKQLT